jgi:DNA-binding transcriptional LysR family regulator
MQGLPEVRVSAVDGEPPETFSLVVVPGVTVEKWTRIWSQRVPEVSLQVRFADVGVAATLIATEADAGLVRLPVDREALHAIPLYTETTVVMVPRDHALAVAEEVILTDLAEETLLRPRDDVLVWTDGPAVANHPLTRSPELSTLPVDTTAAAVELVAAGVGVLVVPQSLARAHHRRDLTYRVVTDAPTSSVALAWRREEPPGLIEDLIGIVRGRTVNSTRGQTSPPAKPSAQPPARKAARRGAPKPHTSPRRGR